MNSVRPRIGLLPLSFVFAGVLACSSQPPAKTGGDDAELPGLDAAADATCGPQAPRDITVAGGENRVAVPQGETPNLCNVHFHKPFEHAGFRYAGDTPGASGEQVCKSVDTGDNIEFHWVYTNCELPNPPKPGLENCVCDRPDMVLRVFAQGYVVGDKGAEITQPSGKLVQYLGSTTGGSHTQTVCSKARVNWEVNPEALALGKSTLQKWCASNPWAGEDHPHAAREPVTNPAWLAPFTP